jgi:hypothetical protein
MAAPSTPTQVSSIFRGLGISGVHGRGTFDARDVSTLHRATTNAAQARAQKVTFRMKDFAGARASNTSMPSLGKIPSSQGKSLISPKLAKALMDKLFNPSSLDSAMKTAGINQMDMSESDMEFIPTGGSGSAPLFGQAGGTTGTLGGM